MAEHVLITGAAGAIGAATALEWSRRRRGDAITLVDIDEQGAAEVAGSLSAATSVRRWDLGAIAQLPGAWEQLVAERGPVDVLVNCAGFMEVCSFAATPWALGRRLIEVDLIAPLRLMELALPGMIERGRGTVVNITSMAGVTPLRGCAYYGAAKAGLAMASEITRMELADGPVRVLTVYPGPVSSRLESRARGQLRDGLLTRHIPTGTPGGLARRVLDRVEAGGPRLAYPWPYDLAERARDVSRRITIRLSPAPRH